MIKHGFRRTRLYKCWIDMKQRCSNPNRKDFKHYGERGIGVCEEWKNDFMCFHDWAMKNGYKDALTIDRINVNGNYEPSNCRWVDNMTQRNNRRNNVLLTYRGETHTVAEWSRITGLKEWTISNRIKYGWDDDRILGTPCREHKDYRKGNKRGDE